MFPQDFRWGTATSSYQVEGNNQNSDWWAWEKTPGAISKGHLSGPAADWWENAERDLDLAAEMGTNAHRLSLEWSRIEPSPSVFSMEAIDRYREILSGMRQRGIEPMVTLHHFSNPLWLVEKGDWGSEVCVDYFRRYTAKVVGELGELIPKWITINEPMVYIVRRYLDRLVPAPQHTGLAAAGRAMHTMLRAHAAAYHTIKDALPEAEVGVAKNMIVLEPQSPGNPLASRWNRLVQYWFNDAWMEFMVSGRPRWPIGRGTIEGLAGSFDFVGINYYSRYFSKFPPFGGFVADSWGPGAVVSDGNYGEVYPDGLFQVIKASRRYNKPIYITENGLPDKTDRLRPQFIIRHLREVWRAINFNYPVMGYYHWSLVDNFEWDQGWTQRFGLLALDLETQERSWRPSGRLYQQICQTGSVSSEMAQEFAPEVMKTLFPG